MTNHGLIRDQDNSPVCACGYTSDVLQLASPVGMQWKAKTDVLNHIEQVRKTDPRRSPDAPFAATAELKYPRAGVRQTLSGRWLLSCWDGDRIVHVIDEPEFDDRKTAFDYGWLTIGACRQSGADLNGYPV